MKSVNKTLPSLEDLSPEDIKKLAPGPLMDAMISRYVFNRKISVFNGEFVEYFLGRKMKPSPYSTMDLQANMALESAPKFDFKVIKKFETYRLIAPSKEMNGANIVIDTGRQKTFSETVCKGILLVIKNKYNN